MLFCVGLSVFPCRYGPVRDPGFGESPPRGASILTCRALLYLSGVCLSRDRGRPSLTDRSRCTEPTRVERRRHAAPTDTILRSHHRRRRRDRRGRSGRVRDVGPRLQVRGHRAGSQVRARKGSVRQVEVFWMGGVGTSIFRGPRRLPHSAPPTGVTPSTVKSHQSLARFGILLSLIWSSPQSSALGQQDRQRRLRLIMHPPQWPVLTARAFLAARDRCQEGLERRLSRFRPGFFFGSDPP